MWGDFDYCRHCGEKLYPMPEVDEGYIEWIENDVLQSIIKDIEEGDICPEHTLR